MSEHGISKALLVYADEQIEGSKESNSSIMDDIQKYHLNALRVKVWKEVKQHVEYLREKYSIEDEDA